MRTNTSSKQSVSFRWDSRLVSSLKEIARRQNRSLSNFTETLLARAIEPAEQEDDTPNEITAAAIEDARFGKNLDPLDPADLADFESFRKYVNSL